MKSNHKMDERRRCCTEFSNRSIGKLVHRCSVAYASPTACMKQVTTRTRPNEGGRPRTMKQALIDPLYLEHGASPPHICSIFFRNKYTPLYGHFESCSGREPHGEPHEFCDTSKTLSCSLFFGYTHTHGTRSLNYLKIEFLSLSSGNGF